MRDIALTLFIIGLLPVILTRPFIGAYAWVWISMMNPHQLMYGFARQVPWALIIAATTVAGALVSKHRKSLPMSGCTVLILLLFAWMSITSLFALNPDTDAVLDRWIYAAKVLFMLVLTFMLLRGRKQIEWLLWAMVVSVGFFGLKGGFWTVLTGGGGRVWGPPGGTLTGNNEFAVALVILLPWMYYLRAVATKRWLRLSLAGAMVFIAFAILGSQSRGALLAGVAMGLMLGVKAKRSILTFLTVAVVGASAITFMPDSWVKRMDTIESYKDDGSAMSRIWTWRTLTNAALDRPLVGAGFRADSGTVFNRYAPTAGFEEFQGRVYVAHSIYFQALGEHGFIGLFIYLALGVWTWRTAGRLARSTLDDPELSTWVPMLMRMTQTSLIGFAVGGAFLAMMLTDLTFYITGIVVLVQATVDERRKSIARATALPDAGTGMRSTSPTTPSLGLRKP